MKINKRIYNYIDFELSNYKAYEMDLCQVFGHKFMEFAINLYIILITYNFNIKLLCSKWYTKLLRRHLLQRSFIF